MPGSVFLRCDRHTTYTDRGRFVCLRQSCFGEVNMTVLNARWPALVEKPCYYGRFRYIPPGRLGLISGGRERLARGHRVAMTSRTGVTVAARTSACLCGHRLLVAGYQKISVCWSRV